jgi:hypothetical protein
MYGTRRRPKASTCAHAQTPPVKSSYATRAVQLKAHLRQTLSGIDQAMLEPATR